MSQLSVATLLDEIGIALRFLTRLPLRSRETQPHDSGGLARAAWAFPLAGVVSGGVGAAVCVLAVWLGLSLWLAGILAVASQLFLTGALHEDGLADCADGLGGRDREHRLAIMRDSAIGSFGALALMLSLLLRVGAIAAFPSALAAGAALISAGAVSRFAMLMPMSFLEPARSDGLSRDAGKVGRTALSVAFLLAFLISLPSLGLGTSVMMFIVAIGCAVAVGALARRRLGGQTGDVLGATQQLAECVCLLWLCTAA